MSARPTLPYIYAADPAGEIALAPGVHGPFISLMDSLYPALVSGSGERRGAGYSAFLMTGEVPVFIGSFMGLCLASVRKNPWFEDREQWFLRALIAGMVKDGHALDHRSRCAATNYGTLRLWDKLGLGAKRTARGDYISTSRDDTSAATLAKAIEYAKPGYADIRAFADKRRSNLSPHAIDALLPNPNWAYGQEATRHRVSL